jgi:hypothetical protein
MNCIYFSSVSVLTVSPGSISRSPGIYCDVNKFLTVQGSREASLYVLDCLFSVLIVGTLVVFVWRGAWTILDLYVYPQQADCSAWTSMVSTYGRRRQWTASVLGKYNKWTRLLVAWALPIIQYSTGRKRHNASENGSVFIHT